MIPWRREWLPSPVFLPGEFHGQRRQAGYSPWGCKELQHDFNIPSLGLPGGAMVNNLQANSGDFREVGSFPASGSSPGGGHSNPAYWATVHRVTKSWTRLKRLSTHSTYFFVTHFITCKWETNGTCHITLGVLSKILKS